MMPPKRMTPFRGLRFSAASIPRALPWAGEWLPLRGLHDRLDLHLQETPTHPEAVSDW